MNEYSYNSSNKKSIKDLFTTKNMLIMLGVVIGIGIVLYFVLGGTSKNSLHCSMDLSTNSDISTSLIVDAKYNDYIESLKGKITLTLLNPEILAKKDDLKNIYQNYFSKIKSKSVKFNVSTTNDTIIIDYSVDYSTYNSEDVDVLKIFDIKTKGADNKITAEKFKNEIIKSGGTCN